MKGCLASFLGGLAALLLLLVTPFQIWALVDPVNKVVTLNQVIGVAASGLISLAVAIVLWRSDQAATNSDSETLLPAVARASATPLPDWQADGWRSHAVDIASQGGMPGNWAKAWLEAHDSDPSVPPFGWPAYWVPGSINRLPELIDINGLKGFGQRVAHAQSPDADPYSLEALAQDCDERIRRIAQTRLDQDRH